MFVRARTASWLLPEVPLRDSVAEHTHGFSLRFKTEAALKPQDDIGSPGSARVYTKE